MKLGKIKGICINFKFSSLLMILFIGFFAGRMYISYTFNPTLIGLILSVIVSSTVVFLSILSHELIHSLIAKKFGLDISEIQLNLFGGVSKLFEEPCVKIRQLWTDDEGYFKKTKQLPTFKL